MRILFLLLLSLSIRSLAFADAIPPMPPMKCDPGARWYSGHEGGGCNPTSCESNTDCEKGEVCQQQGLCITFSTKYGRPDGHPYIHSSAYDSCSPKKACSSGECEVIKRCVPKGTKATPGPENKLTPPELPTPKEPKTPNKQPDPQPDPQPESQPEGQPDSQPDSPTQPPPPTKVDKGRCSIEPAADLPAPLLVLGLLLSLALLKRRK